MPLLQQPSKKKGMKISYARPSTNSRRKQQKPQYKSVVNDKTVKQLLGELYGDRVYLEKLLKETGNYPVFNIFAIFQYRLNALVFSQNTMYVL